MPADGEDDDVGDSLVEADPDNSVVATFLLHWLDRVETEGSGGGGVRSGRGWEWEGFGSGRREMWKESEVGGVRRGRSGRGGETVGSGRGQVVEK